MGLDIHLCCDNYDELSESEEFEEMIDRCPLSRSFCYLVREGARILIGEEYELDQIGLICGADVSVFYEMATFTNENENRELLPTKAYPETESPDKRAASVKAYNDQPARNIERVLQTLDQLCATLAPIPDLSALLSNTNYHISTRRYFAYFHAEGADDRSLGKDLRNLRNSVRYVKEHGAQTVYFVFH